MDLGSLWNGLTGLVAVALRSFARTLCGMTALSVLLAGMSYYLAAEASVWRGVLAALGALLIGTAAGFVVAGQRAVAVALMKGLRKQRLGDAVFALLLERFLGVSREGTLGQRGGNLAQTLERVPLAQAETRLRDAVQSLLHAPPEEGGLGGWFRHRMQSKLLQLVYDVTLARLRQEGATEGGIDLLKVQRKLGDSIDGLLLNQIRRYAVRLTAGVILAATLGCVGLALVLQRIGM